ncbi:regulator, partial [Vibrio cholerae]|nr:regulator [Vibrio cholerae]
MQSFQLLIKLPVLGVLTVNRKEMTK